MITVESELPKGWVNCEFGDIAKIRNGYAFKSSWFKKKRKNESDVPLIRQSQLKNSVVDLSEAVYLDQKLYERFSEFRIFEGDVLIGMSGAIGKVCTYTHLTPSLQNQRTGKIELHTNGKIDLKYLGLFLTTFERSLFEKAKGMGVQNISAKDIYALPFPLPPFNEQYRIVAKIEELFSELDKGIESLKAARAKLDVYRQAVLKHAFEGKLTVQWRDENKDKLETPEQLLTRIKQERETRYDQQLQEWKTAVKEWEEGGESGKRPARPKKLTKVADILHDETAKLSTLPESWVWEKLGWMTCGVEYGTAAKSAKTGRVPVLRMGNIQNTKFDWADLVYTSDENEISEYLLHDGDVLFNRTNSPELVGKTAIYKGERPAVFAGYLIRVNHIPAMVDGQYLNLFLNSHIARQYGNNVKTDGVNQSNINGTKLSNYPFPYCSIEEQNEIAGILEKTFSLLDEAEADIVQELQKADVLRQSILKKAFSGQLVPQDPNDEPASFLLERIKEEQAVRSQNNTRTKRRRMKATA